jgi:hypothetical protein
MTGLLQRARTAEEGFVMVAAIVIMAIVLTVAAVAIDDTVGARNFVTQDARVDAAQQAADAGVQIALYRANQMELGDVDYNGGLQRISTTLGCVVPVTVDGVVTALTTVALGTRTSCPTEQSPPAGDPAFRYESLGNRTSFAYHFIPGAQSNGGQTSGHTSLNPVIVSIGRENNGTPNNTADDVVRRVEAILNPVDPFQVIEATGDLTFNALLTTVINGDIRTNGDLRVNGLLGIVGGNVLASDGSLLRLTNAQYYGNYYGSISIADRDKIDTKFERQPVTISPSKPDCWDGTGPQGTAGACPSSTFYDASIHRLRVNSGQTLTLGGGDYVFCSVSVSAGGTLNTSLTAGAPTRIFIDGPNSPDCNGSSGNLLLNGNLNTISVTPSQLQIYMAGNGTPGGTTATIDTTWTTTLTPAFFLYAPDTDVTMRFRLFKGNIIGHDVTMTAACTVSFLGICIPGATDVLTQDLNLANMPLSASVGVFTQKQYVQCAGYEPPAATPTKDC